MKARFEPVTHLNYRIVAKGWFFRVSVRQIRKNAYRTAVETSRYGGDLYPNESRVRYFAHTFPNLADAFSFAGHCTEALAP